MPNLRGIAEEYDPDVDFGAARFEQLLSCLQSKL
jgi:hypothetical protein